jgi:hypothetical protein
MEFKHGDIVISSSKITNSNFKYKGVIIKGPYLVVDDGKYFYDVELSNWEGKPVVRFGDWQLSIDKEWQREQRLNQLGISDEYYRE